MIDNANLKLNNWQKVWEKLKITHTNWLCYKVYYKNSTSIGDKITYTCVFYIVKDMETGVYSLYFCFWFRGWNIEKRNIY